MPSSSPGRSVTIASACGRSSCGHGRSTVTASAEWTWCTVASSAPGKHRGDRAAPVLVDRLAVVAAAIADVEAGKLAGRHAALPPEEAVGQRAEARRANDLDPAHSDLPHDDVLVGMASDHEVIAPDRDEVVALVEAPRAVIVDKDGEVELVRSAPPGFVERPVHQLAPRCRRRDAP